MPRPATGKTPVRNLRVKNEVWEPALENAQADGTTITNVITRHLEHYNAMTPAERRQAAGLDEPARDEPDTDNTLLADAEALDLTAATRLAALAEEAFPGDWARQAAAGAPATRQPYLIVIAALAEGYLNRSQITKGGE